ncbi:Calcineurin subunit B [Arachis hypogaea]|nr:Calcineurin subunit B [Arachis hypogaea]
MNPLSQRLLKMVDGINFKDFVAFLSAFSAKATAQHKIERAFNDILEVLKDLSGSFMSDEQRERVLSQVLKEAGYTKDSSLTLDDFIKVLGQSELKMDVEIPVD